MAARLVEIRAAGMDDVLVIDLQRGQRSLQLLGGAAQRAIFAPKAGDDGARFAQGNPRIPAALTVVHAGGGEAVAGRHLQGKPAAHAEADDAGPPAAVGLDGQPLARGVDLPGTAGGSSCLACARHVSTGMRLGYLSA